MLIFMKGFFDRLRCAKLSSYLLEQHRNKKLRFEGDNAHYKNSYGASLPEFESLLREMTPMIMEETKSSDLAVKDSYSRIYFNNSTLKRHVDRKGLDVTMTVSIFNNTGQDWPLFVETPEGVKPVVTGIGDAGIILGTKMYHWREPLVCAEDQMVMQCFFHWSLPD